MKSKESSKEKVVKNPQENTFPGAVDAMAAALLFLFF